MPRSSSIHMHVHIATLKTFDTPLTSYKHKDNIKDIATALTLHQMDTTLDLLAYCHQHLLDNPDLQSNPHFTGLLVG